MITREMTIKRINWIKWYLQSHNQLTASKYSKQLALTKSEATAELNDLCDLGYIKLIQSPERFNSKTIEVR